MGRISVVADVHVGNPRRLGGLTTAGLNDRCRLIIDTLKAACLEAHEQGCDALYVLGDLFDTMSPGPRVVAAVQRVLLQSLRIGVPTAVIPGNHDAASSAPGDHALGPLAPVATVVERPSVLITGGVCVTMIPHQPGPAASWLPGAVAQAQSEAPEGCGATPSSASLCRFRCLAVHQGIECDSTPKHLRGGHDALSVELLDDLCVQYGFNAVLAGHWHDPSDVRLPNSDALAVQIGALVPTGWSDAGLLGRGRMVIIDDEEPHITAVEIPGPRFLRAKGPEGLPEALDEADRARHCAVFVEWHAPPDALDVARAEMAAAEQNSRIYKGTVVADVSEANASAQRAATAARDADNLNEALAAYVREMDLPEGVKRARVLTLARRYVGQGNER